ncbi:MAG: hypothetical protein U5S82_11610 [Gammaproteobacteria bacterium]|nr:hypothetical protein [Gammaproteobacteria bacterium]
MKTSTLLYGTLAATLLMAGTAAADEYRIHRDLLYGQSVPPVTTPMAAYHVDRDILYKAENANLQTVQEYDVDRDILYHAAATQRAYHVDRDILYEAQNAENTPAYHLDRDILYGVR